MRGFFITFEGPDGAGKTTQIERLSAYFISLGYTTVTTREPGEGPVGAKIRELILYSGLEICPECEALLYAADRAQHVHKVIIPALLRGEVVICDRFIDSSIAYQGAGRGLGEIAVLSANSLALSGFMPDITFIFDIPPEEAFARKGGIDHLDRIESETLEFHERVYNKFVELSDKYPDRITLIDATGSILDISAAIISRVNSLINECKKVE